MNPASVNAVKTDFLIACGNPLCNVPFEDMSIARFLIYQGLARPYWGGQERVGVKAHGR